eukprot:4445279-Amphidinium_carterae.1
MQWISLFKLGEVPIDNANKNGYVCFVLVTVWTSRVQTQRFDPRIDMAAVLLYWDMCIGKSIVGEISVNVVLPENADCSTYLFL